MRHPGRYAKINLPVEKQILKKCLQPERILHSMQTVTENRFITAHPAEETEFIKNYKIEFRVNEEE